MSSDNQPRPQHCPTPRELDDLELLISGGLQPLTGFNEPGSAVRLELPSTVVDAARDTGQIELVDPEGLPLAVVDLDGRITPLSRPAHGPFRRLHLTPAQVREQYAGRTFVPVVDALTTAQLGELGKLGPLVLLALTGRDTPELTPVALLRASLAAAELLPDAAVVAVPLASHGDADVDHHLGVQVVENYADGDPIFGLAESFEPFETVAARPPQEPTLADARSSTNVESLEDYPSAIAEIIEFDQPPADKQGLVIFFTGLSGSGKSTLAQALMDRILEQGTRTITSLDGDVVRRNLSAGLSFSKVDRETNIRRIGWVAAEIARHGGIAVCSPIAPFDETRQQVRQMVEDAGGAFVLVHVATPLDECERRDRKGLYAKARAGEIPEFTGISSPYEVPEDAAVVVDTTGRTIEDALGDVIEALGGFGFEPFETVAARPPQEPTLASARSATNVDDPIKVLFVCTANICRSAYLDITARHLLGENSGLEISSAGTHGFTEHAIDEVVATQLPDGADITTFRSRKLTPSIVHEADLVLTAEATHRSFILEENPGLLKKVFTLGQFAEAAQDSDASGRELIAEVASRRRVSEPHHDIADPYRRGVQAAEVAAARMLGMLQVVLDALRDPAHKENR